MHWRDCTDEMSYHTLACMVCRRSTLQDPKGSGQEAKESQKILVICVQANRYCETNSGSSESREEVRTSILV